ncbi:methylmalonyl-CoA mutase subunit beta [Tianweitania sp. BSSL-BM11]|uniref:Methylmalonyl-CoA mutase subunit beta n=1 Tax=Tianweitania aestuarii TaxID=2814886 RepID=A0ABS5RVX2_9HYPH|nr:methylmalonyl-CoA mutase subunit beta [Tianweitania aestuarii]MBS9719847.1 methylmalonyl-CoA mutase subunit beta [Tianweitania aestuarii]
MNYGSIKQAAFPDPSMDTWRTLAEKALKGADFDATLLSHTDDGLPIAPLYPRAEPNLLSRANPAKPWTIVQRIDDVDPARANKQALDDIAQGATGLALVFEGAPNAFGYGLPATPDALATALAGIPLNKIHLRIDVHPQSRMSVDWLVEHLTRNSVDPAKLDIALGLDPAAIFGGTGRLRMSIEALAASMPPSLAHFFDMGIPAILIEADGRVYHNAGASEAQELGAMLAAAVSHLRMIEANRQPLQHTVPYLGFALSVDQDQLLSIAKIRALRQLWTRVQELAKVAPRPAKIHAETSYRMMAFKDCETNILRTTIASFAAAVGGADSLSVLPHTITHGLPENFARRIARNTQLILAGESKLDFVVDPAAGSGVIEALTDQLCQAAWTEFQRIEAEGGILQSLKNNQLQARIRETAVKRGEDIRGGKRDVIGTTLYPAKVERPVEVIRADTRPAPTDGAVFCDQLSPLFLDRVAGEAR